METPTVRRVPSPIPSSFIIHPSSFLLVGRTLAVVLIFAALTPFAWGQSSVTLAWDPSTSSSIAGYRLYEGIASRTYTNVIAVGKATTATFSALVSGATYFFAVTAYDTNGLESDFSSEISYSVPLPSLPSKASAVTFSSSSGAITAPFLDSNGTLSQSVTTVMTNGGRATYSFSIAKAGNYLVSALVIAPSQGENSLYVNIDAEPTDPLMIWDIPVSSALTNATVSWRGNSNSDPAAAQYIPKVFHLSAGAHQLLIYGRDANTTLGTITISPAPPSLQISLVAGTTNSLGGPVPLPKMSALLSVTSQAGQAYNILCSQDLVTWTVIGALTLDNTGSGQFTDSAGTSRPRSFYRLQGISITPPMLRISAPAGKPVVLSGNGPTGRSYNVQSSTDFKVWTVIGTVTPDVNGSFSFTDPAATSRPRCLYRLQQQ